jgi:3-hydroxybutyryl-CoA dehydrogenase
MSNFKHISVAGAGTMGASLAQTFALFGYDVKVFDIYETALEKAKRLVDLNQETWIKQGIVTQTQSDDLKKKIVYTNDLQALKNSDFLIEAILENLDIKHKFWKEVSALVRPDAILCSNTSGLSITAIAEAVEHPERFAGMHWMNPPHIIPLIEVIQAKLTSDETIQVVYDFALELKKKPVKVKDAPSFVLNRIQQAILREALYIVQEGIATPEGVDDVMKYALGFRYAAFGPFEICDLGGLDIHNNISKYTFPDLCDAKEPFGLIKDCVDNNNLGVKTGKGFYDYSNGRDAEVIRYRDTMFTKLAKTLFEEE